MQLKLLWPTLSCFLKRSCWSKSDRIWNSSKSDAEKKNNGSSSDATVASAENVSKVSHFLPSFRFLIAGLSVAIRPLCSQVSSKKNTRGSSLENDGKKHSRKDITSYISVDALEISETGCRRKYSAQGRGNPERIVLKPSETESSYQSYLPGFKQKFPKLHV